MRIVATVALVAFSIFTVGCAVKLQPAQQGEWSNFHNPSHKISKDVLEEKSSAEKPPAEK